MQQTDLQQQLQELKQKNTILSNRCQELEYINAKFLQQIENMVEQQSLPSFKLSSQQQNNDQPHQQNHDDQPHQQNHDDQPHQQNHDDELEQTMDQSKLKEQMKELKQKLQTFKVDDPVQQQNQHWKQKYDIKQIELIEITKKYNQVMHIVQSTNLDNKQVELLLHENKQQGKEILKMAKENQNIKDKVESLQQMLKTTFKQQQLLEKDNERLKIAVKERNIVSERQEQEIQKIHKSKVSKVQSEQILDLKMKISEQQSTIIQLQDQIQQMQYQKMQQEQMYQQQIQQMEQQHQYQQNRTINQQNDQQNTSRQSRTSRKQSANKKTVSTSQSKQKVSTTSRKSQPKQK